MPYRIFQAYTSLSISVVLVPPAMALIDGLYQ